MKTFHIFVKYDISLFISPFNYNLSFFSHGYGTRIVVMSFEHKSGFAFINGGIGRFARFLEFIFGFKLHFARAGIKRTEGWRREQRVVGGQTADW